MVDPPFDELPLPDTLLCVVSVVSVVTVVTDPPFEPPFVVPVVTVVTWIPPPSPAPEIGTPFSSCVCSVV